MKTENRKEKEQKKRGKKAAPPKQLSRPTAAQLHPRCYSPAAAQHPPDQIQRTLVVVFNLEPVRYFTARAVNLSLLSPLIKRLFPLDFNMIVTPIWMGVPFREFTSYLQVLNTHTDMVNRMSSVGVPLPIYHIRPYKRKLSVSVCAFWLPPPLS